MNYINEKNIISDEKIKLYNEIIENIRLVKMYAWELAFTKIVNKIREKEVN